MKEAGKNNPIQIVLNSGNYLVQPEHHPGKHSRDFFAGKDTDFAKHKEHLVTQVDSIRDHLTRSPAGETAFVKVRLRKEAWAKSHRPTEEIFVPTRYPFSGSEGIGEIFYRVSASSLPKLVSTIQRAEPETRYRYSESKESLEPAPSRLRSEVGSIENIQLPSEAERRSFSAKTAVDWLSNPKAGRMYVVDLFGFPTTYGLLLSSDDGKEKELLEHLVYSLNQLDFGVVVFQSGVTAGKTHGFLYLRPVSEKKKLHLKDLFNTWDESFAERHYDPDEEKHDRLLRLLSAHPVVKRVLLPPILQATQRVSAKSMQSVAVPAKAERTKYPRVGVIDSGVDLKFSEWILGRTRTIDPLHRNDDHGSLIAGLLVAARAAGNSEEVAREEDGCEIVDLDLFPNPELAGVFTDYYRNGFEDFLQELNLAIASAKRNFGTRIFNLSLNVEEQVEETYYSPVACLLDAIAERHDVIIVVSAGNLHESRMRGGWPSDPKNVASYLYPQAAHDRIFKPAESVFAISVGAVNPPGCGGNISGAPTRYTRRGPGMKVGVKPDFGHYGGANGAIPDSGLYSIDRSGNVAPITGTSFAAPLVAKTLATLECSIEGYVAREMLLALMVHGAATPQILCDSQLTTVARNFVGFGIPAASRDILLNSDNAITLMFNDVLTRRRQLNFDFAWPQALVKDGKCFGAAQLTLVYKPFLDASCGAEFIRVNLDAHLRQQRSSGKYEGRADQVFVSGAKNDVHFEADLIEFGLKWWPMKHYRMNISRGLKGTSNWRLVVESLVRDGVQFPTQGIPFCAILTIADPEGEKDIFNTMKTWLTANRVNCDDVRTASRVRPRR